MELMNEVEVSEVNGGLAWSMAAGAALADTGSLGPLVWAFGVGYGVGSLLAHYMDL
jgi:hypothetical protein